MPGFSVGLGLLSRPKISSFTHLHGTMDPRWPFIPMAEFSLHDGASRRSGGRSLGITRFRTSPWNGRILDCYSERMESRSPPPPVRQAAARIASLGTRKARKLTSSQKSEKEERRICQRQFCSRLKIKILVKNQEKILWASISPAFDGGGCSRHNKTLNSDK